MLNLQILKSFIKFRHLFWVIGLLVAVSLLVGVEFGSVKFDYVASLVHKFAGLPSMVFGVALIYFGTKALLDFIDQGKLYEKAMETSQGAGLAMIAISITRISVALITMAMLSIFIS